MRVIIIEISYNETNILRFYEDFCKKEYIWGKRIREDVLVSA